VQRSPAIMKVAVPWLQHSQRFGHCALSQTVCNRKSEISAFVEKKTGFDGSRTLIQGGFCAWCSAGSILMHDISKKTTATGFKIKAPCGARREGRSHGCAVRDGRYSFVLPESAAESVNSSADSRPPPAGMPHAMRVSVTGLLLKRSTM